MRYGMQKAAVYMSNQCIKCSGLERRQNAVAKGGENVYTCTIQTSRWCCTIKVDIENSKGQYIEKDKQEATKDGSESTKIQHGI